MDDKTTISLAEICQKCNLSEAGLLDMIEHGLFSSHTKSLKRLHVDYQTCRRIQSATRLQHDLGINLAGAVLVLELLEELEHARDELRILKRYVGR